MRRYSYLFSQLVRRELRQKYQGSVVGVLWYFVNPLLLMAVYGVMLGPLLKATHYSDYPIFILAGLVVWLFFAQALLAAATSLVDQASLVSKVRFPRETIPAASVTVQLVPAVAMLVVLIPVALAIRSNASASLLLLVPVLVCLFAFTLGVALIAAALHAYFRDVQPILSAVMLPWFFLSGVLFDLQTLPGVESHPWVGSLLRWVNPVAPFIDAVRSVVYDGRGPGLATLGYVLAAAAVALGAGVTVFRRLDRELAVVL
ncbi:MAG TPA: ABC transporter permease [Solirubrobacteraceae bacterium]|jgi:ABC-type polysaccharide/polyol phosphate export permease|nr:ABC transporter permease [Solirubrobacteraceae bacterium]